MGKHLVPIITLSSDEESETLEFKKSTSELNEALETL
jgi:hypothetical protein